MNYGLVVESPMLRPAGKAADSRQPKAKEVESKPAVRGRRYRLAVTLVSLLLIAMLALFALDRMLSPTEFHIEKVQVNGAVEQVDAGEVEKRIWQSLQGNYFGLDLERLEAEVEELPWIHKAVLHRRWPGTLLVDLDEVQPVAKWDESRWLNVTGDLVQLPDTAQLAKLPRLSGPEGEEVLLWSRFRDWQGLMAANGALLRVLELDDRGTWTLHFSLSPLAATGATGEEEAAVVEDAGDPPLPGIASDTASEPPAATREVKIMARNEDVEQQLARFVRALKFTFLDQLEQIDYVDLRYPNGFAIRWRESLGDAQEKKD